MAKDYHDYFIKDGRHIGRYEEMYRECPDPWNIEKLGLRLDMQAAALLLVGYERRVKRFLDVGAGLGFFTEFLARNIWQANPEARGLVTDISSEAVKRATEKLNDPRLEFQALDVRTLARYPILPPAGFDLVVLAQVLWGLLENLNETLAALAALLPPNGLMLVSQHFPGTERQTYGRETVSSPQDLAYCLKAAGLTVINTLETNRLVNHHWAAILSKDA